MSGGGLGVGEGGRGGGGGGSGATLTCLWLQTPLLWMACGMADAVRGVCTAQVSCELTCC